MQRLAINTLTRCKIGRPAHALDRPLLQVFAVRGAAPGGRVGGIDAGGEVFAAFGLDEHEFGALRLPLGPEPLFEHPLAEGSCGSSRSARHRLRTGCPRRGADTKDRPALRSRARRRPCSTAYTCHMPDQALLFHRRLRAESPRGRLPTCVDAPPSRASASLRGVRLYQGRDANLKSGSVHIRKSRALCNAIAGAGNWRPPAGAHCCPQTEAKSGLIESSTAGDRVSGRHQENVEYGSNRRGQRDAR